MDIARDFGIIRSLLSTPSPNAWKRLSGVVDRYRDHWDNPFFQEQVLPYIERRLAAWPTDLWRFAQHSWLHNTMIGLDVPQMQLANAIHLVGHTLDERRLGKLFNSPYLGEMRYIDLSSKAIGETIIDLLGSDVLCRLEVLDLSRTWLRYTAVELLAQSPTMRTLRRLDISNNVLRDASCLSGSPYLVNLEVLCARSTRWRYVDLETILTGWRMPKLRELDVRRNQMVEGVAGRRPSFDYAFPVLESVLS